MKLRLSGAGDQFSILGLHHRNTHDSRGRGVVQPIGVPNLYGAPSIGPALGGANFNTSPIWSDISRTARGNPPIASLDSEVEQLGREKRRRLSCLYLRGIRI